MMSYVVDVVRRIVDGVLFADGQLQLSYSYCAVLTPVSQEREKQQKRHGDSSKLYMVRLGSADI